MLWTARMRVGVGGVLLAGWLSACGAEHGARSRAPAVVATPAASSSELEDGEENPTLAGRATFGGKLDPSFGDGGVRLFGARAGEHRLAAFTVLPDGSIAGAGHAQFAGSTDVAAVRLTKDGAVDTAFGSEGVARVGSFGGFGRAIAHDSSGRLIVAGYCYRRGTGADLIVARLDATGRLDPGFGKDGIVVHHSGNDDRASDVLVQGSRAIVVGYHSGARNQAVAFAADGALDPSYGDGGTALFTVRDSTERAYATRAVRTHDGGIVIGGYLPQSKRGFSSWLDGNGKPNSRFGEGGSVVPEVAFSSVWAVAVDGEGRVLLGGRTPSDQGIVIRLRRDGRLDPSWGDGGMTSVQRGAGDSLYALLSDASGNWIGVGSRGLAEDARLVITRYSSRGVLDAALGDGGSVTRAVGGQGGTFGFAGAFDREGRLLVGGEVWAGDASRFFVARFR